MELPFIVYVLDTETTGLNNKVNEIIELSILRLNDNVQQTWCIKPTRYDVIEQDALRVNGHKLADLKWETAYGRETYKEMSKVLPDIENFFMSDGEDSGTRILCGQNVNYDLQFLREMWTKANTIETFPFGDRPKIIDTLQLALFLDLVKGSKEPYYNLSSLVERYGLKKLKAHTASQDVLMTKDVLLAQMNIVKKSFERKEK